jgi:hypothetical protein
MVSRSSVHALVMMQRKIRPPAREVNSAARPSSERFRLGPEFDLPRPGAALLTIDREIRVGDRVGVEQRAGPAWRPLRIGDAVIDHDVAHMDVL